MNISKNHPNHKDLIFYQKKFDFANENQRSKTRGQKAESYEGQTRLQNYDATVKSAKILNCKKIQY